MAYFIFLKNYDDKDGSLYKIAENQSDLNNLNIFEEDYKTIEVSQENFNAVKFNLKNILKYNGENITYSDNVPIIKNKTDIESQINFLNEIIQRFLQNNESHTLFNRWNSYLNQLNILNLDSITYPINKSLEQYLNDLGQPSYNILQLP
jgi:hypothetical protein